MADISFYKYLEAAFRYKLFKNRDAVSFKNPPYNLPYEGNRGIFDYARKALPSFYTTNFPNTAEGHLQMAASVINKLDKKLDSTLEKYFNSATIPQGYETLIAEVQTVSQQQTGQAPVGEDAAAMAGGSHFPSVSIPGSPIIHNIPHTPSEPKTPIPKAFEDAFKNEPEYKTDPTKSAPKTGRSFQAPRIPASFTNAVKNFGSRAGIFFKKNSGRIFGGLGEIAKGIGRGIVGPGLTGAYNLGAKAGVGGINAFARLSNQAAGRGAALKGSLKPSGKFGARFAIAGLIAVFLFIFISGMSAGAPETPPPGGTTPIGSDISSCKFTRGDENPKEASFKSNVLLGYVQEASQKSSIPSVVLASFIRVESPSSVNYTNESLNTITCGVSTTGALGLMQLQPKGTTGHDEGAIAQGAKLIGKTYDELTREDYCDMQKNIIMGAGFILKKMSYQGYGDGTKWDPAWTNNKTAIETLVNGYYGCLLYGGKTDCTGPYNYADDVSASIKNCQQTTPIPPPANGDLKQLISAKFGIDFQGTEFTADRLQAAWEILNQAQQVAPNFLNLLGKGITVTTHLDTSERVGNTIYFSTRAGSFFMTGSPQQFKVLLIHELGHIIRGDTGSTKTNNYDQQLQSAVNKDGGYLTGYGENPCYGTLNIDEDFAETVTYYINKGAKEEDLGCGVKSTKGFNPLESGLYPAHLDFIQTTLGKP